MIVTPKSIPRRTVLRGIGAAVALPFLDSMVPGVCCDSEQCGEPGPSVRRRLCAEWDGDAAFHPRG